MEIFLFISAGICAYLIAGFNPAIALSKLVYHKDIRECGSKNPGFTNFKRTFGGKLAWVVFALDILKGGAVVGVFGLLFKHFMGEYQLGVAFTGFFAVLGHAYPIMYKFKGGKGFLVCLSTSWLVDWRVGLICTAIMVALLLITKYMSLSTIIAMLSAPITLAIFGADIITICLVLASVLFMTWRHKENIKRLIQKKESKFEFKKKKS